MSLISYQESNKRRNAVTRTRHTPFCVLETWHMEYDVLDIEDTCRRVAWGNCNVYRGRQFIIVVIIYECIICLFLVYLATSVVTEVTGL